MLLLNYALGPPTRSGNQAEDEYVEIPLREPETFEEYNRRCDEQEAALQATAQAALCVSG